MSAADPHQAARPPLERMLKIHQQIAGDKFPNCSHLARGLEVCRKTILRDLAFMRDRLDLPLEYDATRRGYCYTAPVDNFPTVQVSEGELFALLIAQRALSQYRGTPFEAPLASAFRKITEGLRASVFISLDHLDTPVTFRPIGVARTDLQNFQIVARAVSEHRELVFEYCKIDSSRYRRRRVRPYHLVCVDNQWYLVSHDCMRGAIRTFALVRMKQPALSAKRFEKPGDFSIEKHLRAAFGIFAGKPKYSVRVEFDAFAARLIREKSWHPAQKIRDLPDGRLEFRVRLASLHEIERWILSWGTHARVLGPPKLVRQIKSTARTIAAGD